MRVLTNYFLYFIIVLVNTYNSQGQVTRYPATATVSLVSPYPVYLSDYVAPQGNKLTIRVAFNDFNEPSRDIYLRLYIESSSIRIQTRADYFPEKPLTVIPGSPLLLSGDDLFPLLDYKNIDILGASRDDIIKNGRLPEGMYVFQAEVYDYKSRQALSLKGSTNAYLRLNDPPVVLLPQSGSVIKPADVQNITFQWQVNNVDPSNTQYKLSLYEITTSDATPETSIDNGFAQQIFQSDNTSLTTYNYDAQAPILQKGKRYAFTVQAFNKEDKSIFRNDGKSKTYWFYYGYPENGKIELKSPADKWGFNIRSTKYFEWGAPNKLTPNQPLTYQFKIVKLNGLSPEKAIDEKAWFDETFQTSFLPNGNYQVLNKPLEPKTEYGWQVKAYSDDQMVAKSPVYTFTGPPIIEEFYAGVHRLEVLQTEGTDLSDLSGYAKIKLLENKESFKVRFEHLNIRDVAGLKVLDKGKIVQKIDSFPLITLNPKLEENKTARFLTDSFRIDKNGIEIKGRVEWNYPHAVKSVQKPIVRSVSCWLSYNTLKVVGIASLAPDNNFDLIDPGNFKMKLSERSIFLIYENQYQIQFSGDMELPKKVKGTMVSPVNIPFVNASQLYYIIDTVNLINNIRIVPNTEVNLLPRVVHIDLSEKKSPFDFAADPSWKGIYFEHYDILFGTSVDNYKQLSFNTNIIQSFTPTEKTYAWVVSTGLFLLSDYTFKAGDKGRFNTFPGDLGVYYLKSENSTVFNGYLKGSIKIPIVSETKDYTFTIPISADGFQTGYLDESLDGIRFLFNEAGGEEQKLNFTVNRAVFSDKERLDINVTIEWPFLGVTFKNIDGLRLYGNYNIGFNQPNGATSLAEQIRSTFKGFDITIDFLGCGRQGNMYAIGTSAKILMGEDISGENGPPVSNLYSIAENKLLDGIVIATGTTDENSIPLNQGTSSAGSGTGTGEKQDEGTTDESKFVETLENITVTDQTAELQTIFAETTTPPANDGQYQVTQPTSDIHQLTSEQEGKLRKLIFSLSKQISAPLASRATQVTGSIADRIKVVKDSAVAGIRLYAGKVIDPIKRDMQSSFSGNDIAVAVIDICAYTLNESVNAILDNLNTYIDTAIIIPLRNSGANLVYNTTNSFLYSISYDVITSNGSFDFRSSLDKAVNAVAQNFDINKVRTQINAKAQTFAKTFLDGDNLLNIIKSSVIKKLAELAEVKIKNAAADYIAAQIGSSEAGAIAKSVLNNVKFDFSNLGDKLKSGRIDKIIKLDPSYIVIKTSVADIEGMVKFYDDDPEWGNSWQATLGATIKIAPSFSAMVRYINGSKPKEDPTGQNAGDFKFWFLQVRAKGLNVPMSPIPITFDGAEGLVYYHMKKINIGSYLPDPDTKYGVGLRAFFFDTPSTGSLIVFNVGLELAFIEGGFIMQLDGQADIANLYQGGQFVKSIISANGLISYNSVEKHFLASLNAHLNTAPLICGEGEFITDITPDQWHVAMGTREQPVMIQLLCKDILYAKSWFALNSSGLDLGFNLGYKVNIESPWLGPKACRVRAYAYAGFDFGVETVIFWKPAFGVQEAKIWMDFKAGLGVKYETFFHDGDLDFASVELSGNVDFTTVPATHVKGTLHGEISVLGFGIGLEMGVDKTL
jgi:hypothetical protein